MLSIAAGLFAVSALGGLTLAILHFKGKDLPLPLALLHGLLGASGLLLLVLAVLKGGTAALVVYSLGLFILAALGGFYLFSFHLRKKKLPSPVVVIHALAAVTAFGLLVVVVLLGA